MIASLALSAVLSVAQVPSQPSKQIEPGTGKSNAATQSKREPTPAINVTVTTPEKSAAEKENERQRAERQDLTNERIAQANDRIAALTFWLVMVGALQTLATTAAFLIGIRTANAAKKSAIVAERTLHLSQRAYLTMTDSEFSHFNPGEFPNLVLRVKNDGRLPATVTAWMCCFLIDEDFPPHKTEDEEFVQYSAVLGSNQQGILEMTGNAPRGLLPEEFAKIQKGQMRVRIYGAIKYESGFGPGEMGFALEYDPNDIRQPPHRRFSVSNAPSYNYSR